jgi:uncharacterized cupin superfamily protein
MAPEAPLRRSDTGLVPAGEGWFVLNARDAQWEYANGRGARLRFEGEVAFAQVGVSVFVLEPGEPIGMYHWEADQEDFLVLAGEALLIIENRERPLRRWDFVHCPPGANHIIIGAGSSPCVILATGAREHQHGAAWGGYPVNELALGHGASTQQETSDWEETGLADREPTRYREGWLPGS